MCCHRFFAILPCIPSTGQRSMCELGFRKGYMGRALAIHHFSHGHCRAHTAPPSFSRSTKLQHDASPAVLRPVMESLTPVLDHPRRAEPILNGLKYRTCEPTSFQHIVAPPASVMSDGRSLGTVESHCAMRRCRTLPGTASPDAMPQRPDWQSHRPAGPAVQFLQRE